MKGIKERSWRYWAGRHTLAIALLPVLAATLSGPGTAIAADQSDVETRIKDAFIYNFARFVEWPAHANPGPMRIGVLGRGDLASPLEDIVRGKLVNGRPIQVVHISVVTEADCCEILLIERSESSHLKEIAQALAEKPILTVCDSGNCLRDGVMIGFRIVEETVRFQINQEAAQHAGLIISSQLLKVAIPSARQHP
jgi:hypothetical protein